MDSAALDREAKRIEIAAYWGINPADISDEVLDREIAALDVPDSVREALAETIARSHAR